MGIEKLYEYKVDYHEERMESTGDVNCYIVSLTANYIDEYNLVEKLEEYVFNNKEDAEIRFIRMKKQYQGETWINK